MTLHSPVEEEGPRVVANSVEPAVTAVPQHSSQQKQTQPRGPRSHHPGLYHLPWEEPPGVQQRLQHQNHERRRASRVEKLLRLHVGGK